MKSNKREMMTAYHEAGHAVAMLNMGLAFKKISIATDDNGGLKRVLFRESLNFNHDVNYSGRVKDRAEAYAISCFAGAHAEAKYKGKSLKLNLRKKGRSRVNVHAIEALGFIDYFVEDNIDFDELEAYANWLWIRSRNFMGVSHNWMAVKKLAKELMIHRKISYQAAREIVAKIG